MSNSILPSELVEQIIKDRKIRIAVTKQSHLLFFHSYFGHYVKYETAPFQKEIFHLTERADIRNVFICAFRGSGKSTIITTSYPIWAILGEQQIKFVLILCHTKSQAKQHMMNLKRELETNELLKNDLGPFQEESDEWGSGSLVFSNLNARITVASSEQSIRGLRHDQHRPGLIIADDVEDLASAKTRDGRNKIYQWLTSEVIPSGDKDTRLFVIGNLLHEDSLLMRLKADLEENRLDGVFKSYPIIDENNKIFWPGKFPTTKEIEDEKRKTGNEISWQREYMLRIVPDEDQVIHQEWIQYYETFPTYTGDYHGHYVGVDLAISQRDTADYTAIATSAIYGNLAKLKIYILPNPINKRLTHLQTIDTIKSLYNTLKDGYGIKIIIEDVGYQMALAEQLTKEGYTSEGMKVPGDKRSRLMLISHLIQSGQILFPRQGCEELLEQIIGFGVEKHDDLVDAFTLMVLKIMEQNEGEINIRWLCSDPSCWSCLKDNFRWNVPD